MAKRTEPKEKRFYYKQNRLKQLRAFCAVAQTGSMSKAAERLFLSQPSISLQIKALESELDVVLFERLSAKVLLTPAGQTLYELSAPLLEGIDTLPETFLMQRGVVEKGELNIAAGESTILYILPNFVTRFAKLYPQVDLRLHNVTGRDGLAQIHANEVDFAVGSMLDVPDDITYKPIFSYDPVLITATDHPLLEKQDFQLTDISPYGLILPPRHLSTWGVVNTVFQKHNVKYRVSLEAGGWEVIKKYVALGMGVSIVTSICLTENDPLGHIPLNDYFPQRSYGVVMRTNKFLSPAARRFIELMDPEFFLHHTH